MLNWLNWSKINCGDMLTLCNSYNKYKIDEIKHGDKFYSLERKTSGFSLRI